MTNQPDRVDESTGESVTGSGVSGVDLSQDAALDLVSHHRRRTVLRTLRETSDGTATVEDLVTQCVDQTAEGSSERPGRRTIETRLTHVHLPKLAEAGVVEFDTRSGAVRYWHDDFLDDLLDYLPE